LDDITHSLDEATPLVKFQLRRRDLWQQNAVADIIALFVGVRHAHFTDSVKLRVAIAKAMFRGGTS